MITMLTLNENTTVLYTSTPEDRRAAAWEEAVARVMDTLEADEWEDTPTYESNGVGRNFNHLCDVGFNHRTSPKYNFTSRNRDRK